MDFQTFSTPMLKLPKRGTRTAFYKNIEHYHGDFGLLLRGKLFVKRVKTIFYYK